MVMAPEQWVLGVFLCLFGACATNLGLTVQKLSFIRNECKSFINQVSFARQPLWLLGLMVFLIGQLLNFAAMAYSSQAVAATLGSFSLVTNAIFAPFLLGEKLTKQMIASLLIIISGSIIVVLSSDHSSQDYNLIQLLKLYNQPIFVVYITLLTLALIATLIRMWKFDNNKPLSSSSNTNSINSIKSNNNKNKLSNQNSSTNQNQIDIESNIDLEQTDHQNDQIDQQEQVSEMSPISHSNYNNNNQKNYQNNSNNHKRQESSVRFNESNLKANGHQLNEPLLNSDFDSYENYQNQNSDSNTHDDDDDEENHSPFYAISPTICGAILSSLSVLFGKSTSMLIKYSIKSENQFKLPISWLIVIVFSICAIGSVHFLNIGLRRGSALFIIPLYYVSNTVLSILGGLIYFKEFQQLDTLNAFLFALGVVITITGVYISSRKQVKYIDDDDEELIDDQFAQAYNNMIIQNQAELERRKSMLNQSKRETSSSQLLYDNIDDNTYNNRQISMSQNHSDNIINGMAFSQPNQLSTYLSPQAQTNQITIQNKQDLPIIPRKRNLSEPCIDAVFSNQQQTPSQSRTPINKELQNQINNNNQHNLQPSLTIAPSFNKKQQLPAIGTSHEAEGSFHIDKSNHQQYQSSQRLSQINPVYGTFNRSITTGNQLINSHQLQYTQSYNHNIMNNTNNNNNQALVLNSQPDLQRSYTTMVRSTAKPKQRYSYRTSAFKSSFNNQQKRYYNVAFFGAGVS